MKGTEYGTKSTKLYNINDISIGMKWNFCFEIFHGDEKDKQGILETRILQVPYVAKNVDNMIIKRSLGAWTLKLCH